MWMLLLEASAGPVGVDRKTLIGPYFVSKMKKKLIKPQRATTTTTVSYALRDPITGKYWKGNLAIGSSSRRHRGRRFSIKAQPWTPYFDAQPVQWKTKKKVLEFYEHYVVQNDNGAAPVLELVCFRQSTVTNMSVEPIELDPVAVFSKKMAKALGVTVSNSYLALLGKGNDMSQYPFACRTKGRNDFAGTIECLKNLQIVWVKNDRDLMYAKLLLGDNFSTSYDIVNLRKL